MARVILAMSGGVDSSVAAQLLLDAGHEVIGVFMRHGEDADAQGATQQGGAQLRVLGSGQHRQGCCSAEDAADARWVAGRLEIPFYALNLQAEFHAIVDYFVEEYASGRTPNPCVMCNNWIKFGRLFDYADSVGAEYVATGHYARVVTGPGQQPHLLRGIDPAKDQSYVLFGVDRRYLSRMLLPVGGFQKTRIRAMAAQLGLRVADKRDSQEICFVSRGRHAEFVRSRCERETAGEVVTTDGRVVGRHEGIEAFTVGQRKGLGIALGEPYFVVRIERDTRRVVIGPRDELARREVLARNVNWLCEPPGGPLRCFAKIRYNGPAAEATAECLPGAELRVHFDQPREGVAPGQAVVCYDGDRVLGGGWIVDAA